MRQRVSTATYDAARVDWLGLDVEGLHVIEHAHVRLVMRAGNSDVVLRFWLDVGSVLGT